jgi:large subunit ribosomal protein L6
MSRIGRKPIVIPEGVNVSIKDSTITVKGSKGELSYTYNSDITVKVENNEILVTRPSDDQNHRMLHGTTRANINNMVTGVHQEFTKTLEIEGVGYRAQLQGKTLVLSLGYSHLVNMEIPAGLKVTCPQATQVVISGCDKQLVGEFAANVRGKRKPEPYKGKGIHYSDEHIRRKEGKKAK